MVPELGFNIGSRFTQWNRKLASIHNRFQAGIRFGESPADAHIIKSMIRFLNLAYAILHVVFQTLGVPDSYIGFLCMQSPKGMERRSAQESTVDSLCVCPPEAKTVFCARIYEGFLL